MFSLLFYLPVKFKKSLSSSELGFLILLHLVTILVQPTADDVIERHGKSLSLCVFYRLIF